MAAVAAVSPVLQQVSAELHAEQGAGGGLREGVVVKRVNLHSQVQLERAFACNKTSGNFV